MPTLTRPGRRAVLALAVGAVALVPALSAPAASAATTTATTTEHGPERAAGAAFVQLNDPAGNAIAAYDRARDGSLTRTGTYPTGGHGGYATNAPVDALASQHSLELARGGSVLVAVNAGSDSVTSFAVRGSRLLRTSVVPSGGSFPVSVAVRGDLVYVLDAGGSGAVSGYRLVGPALVPIPGSTRSLGLANTTPPVFISAPAQVGFAGHGRVLVVTTKNNGTILTFPLGRDGRASAAPVTTASGPVPFSFAVDQRGGLHVTETGEGTIASYAVHRDGTLTATGRSQPTGGAALCWVVRVGRSLYGSNTGSGTLSRWHLEADGAAALTDPVAAKPQGAPIDLAASRDGRFLYVQDPVGGALHAYRVGRDGSLADVQTVTGLPKVVAGNGMEGLAVS